MLTPRNWTSMVVALVTMLGWIAPVVGQCQYQVTIIPEAPCLFGLSMGPHAINRHGHVVGSVNCVGGGNPVAWYGGPNLTFLPIPPGYVSGRAMDINDADEICGYVADSNGSWTACVWRNGQPSVLGIPTGGNYSTAEAINNKGEICGYWGDDVFGNPASRACVWRNGTRQDLIHTLAPQSIANDINDASHITGWMGTADTIDARAFRWTAGGVEDLGLLPGGFTGEGMVLGGTRFVALRGRVQADGHMFGLTRSGIWRQGSAVNFGVLPQTNQTLAMAANDHAVVGISQDHPNNNIALGFIYQEGTLRSLTSLTPGASVTSPQAINQRGIIATRVEIPGQGNVAAILTPISRNMADVTSNCRVNVEDLLAVIGEWHETDSVADLNNDRYVDVGDLIIVILNWAP